MTSRARPVTPAGLVAEVVERVERIAASGGWVRVAIDGAPPAGPGDLADSLVDPLRERGRAAVRVRSSDYLRPRSLRYEHGRTDPHAFYEDWLDVAALNREALTPLSAGGTGRVRPAHWDPATDRAVRGGEVDVPPGGVLLLSGALLLGGGLEVDLSVHLELSAAALARRTPADLAWTLPAYARYAAEVAPADWADVVVRVDDPRHPAIVERD
jgi:hypothetical protein